MTILIPFISFFLFWSCFYQKTRHGCRAFLFAAALWGSIVWFLTETLSWAHGLSFVPLLIGWSMAMLGAGCWAFSCKGPFGHGSFIHQFKALTFTEKTILFLIVTIAVLKGISAIYSAPNTSDAMTYHLNRVEHWIQNGTVADYPSHVTRQLYSPPWAEYAILQLRVLSGGDHFSNAVQWFSAIGAWVSVAGLSQMLGASRRGQLLSVLLAASLPMGLVQATSTQTDYVMTFWLAGFVYLLWMMYQKPGRGIAVAAGTYLGLAFLTKGNAYVFAPVWVAVYIMALILARHLHKLKFLALIVVIAGIINFPYALRNTFAFGSPYWTHTSLTNDSFSVPALMSNMAYNLALHTHFQGQSTGEDDTGNGLYLILLAAVLAGLVFYRPLRHKVHLIYGLCVIAMFVVFSAVVHCDQFNSRFHLAIFVISTALVGTVLVEWLPYRWVWAAAAVLIYVSSWAWLFKCNEHPLIGDRSIFVTTRPQQYFSTRPMLIYPYVQTVKIVASSSCRDIGLISGESEWGYTWWVFFRQNFGDKFRLEDVDVKNKSAFLPYPRGSFDPCLLIASNDERSTVVLPGGVYARAWSMQLPGELTSVFVKVL